MPLRFNPSSAMTLEVRPQCEGLDAQDKVPDQPEEIRAVSLTLYRLERQKTSARCD